MPPTLMPLLAAATLALIAFIPLGQLFGQAWPVEASAADPVLLDVRIADATSATVQAWRNNDTILLPSRYVCALAELPCASGTESYVTSDSIAVLLHGHVEIDLTQLMVLVSNCDALPVVRRYARAAARAALIARSYAPVADIPDLTVQSPLRLGSAAMLDYSLVTPSRSLSGATHTLHVGTTALGGAVDVQLVASHSARSWLALSSELTGISWLRAWPGERTVRQLRVGDVANAFGTDILRGLSITNAPYAANGDVDSVHVTGTALRGREVEVYRDGALVGATSATIGGVYSFWLPSSYGLNSFTVASYGPGGGTSFTHRTLLIPPGMLPARTLRYALAAGACLRSSCSGAVDFGLRYAPSDRVTAAIELDAIRHGGSRSIGIDAQLLTRVSDAITVSFARNDTASTAASLHVAPSEKLDILATYASDIAMHTRSSGKGHDSHIPHIEAGTYATWRPSFSRWQPSLTLQATTRQSALQSITVARMTTTIPLSAAYIAPFATYTSARSIAVPSRQSGSLGIDGFAAITHAPSFLSRSLLRLRVETSRSSDRTSATLSLSIPAGVRLRFDLQGSWSTAERSSISVGIKQLISEFRLTSALSRSPTGQLTAVHALQRVMLVDMTQRRITSSRAGSPGSASITGTVFIDRNQNGRLDHGEQGLPGVYVRAGDGGALSDSTGEYTLSDLPPFSRTILKVDALTLPSPTLVLLHRAIAAQPIPNQRLRVDIPILDSAQALALTAPASPDTRYTAAGAMLSVVSLNIRSAATRLPSIATISNAAPGMRTRSPTLGSRPRLENTKPPSVDQSPSGTSSP